MFVKICGLRTPEAVAAAVAAGADALGFVFAESPRRVTPQEARALCAQVPSHVVRVAVMLHPVPAEWRAVLDGFAPDWMQTDAGDLAAMDLPAGCEPLPVYRSGGVPPADDLPQRLLFEGTVSGSGLTADWDQAAALAARTSLMLAGGLNADNVGEAIRRVRPFGVDVSSGVERARGEKDNGLIKTFIARVRALESAA
jgi:phosphoribosylanthranilate isomerase